MRKCLTKYLTTKRNTSRHSIRYRLDNCSAMTDAQYMKRCLQLAANGLGRVRPNPMVGCVVVKDDAVVAEGFHQQYGGFHAERNALLSTSTDLNGATLYVNLEPCSHYGKTPPCADLVVEKGIKRVVCCNDDPNPLVAGRGFAKLEKAGIEVVRHVLKEEGRHLNRRFFTYMEQQRPYIILKWAESADGFMAPPHSQWSNDNGKPYWISTPQQTLLSHKWRTEEAAILVGSQTYIDDHPTLSARLFAGQNPKPIVLDRRGRIKSVPDHWLHLDSDNIKQVLKTLFDNHLQSVIVEGGFMILNAFIEADLYDEVRILRSNTLLNGGLKAPTPPNRNTIIYTI